MQTRFRCIQHADGRTYYAGEPISLADAHIMINDDIARRAVFVGSYLRVAGPALVIEPPAAGDGSR